MDLTLRILKMIFLKKNETDIDDEGMDKYLEGYVENKESQRIIEQQMESMEHQTGDTLEETRQEVIKEKVDAFKKMLKKSLV